MHCKRPVALDGHRITGLQVLRSAVPHPLVHGQTRGRSHRPLFLNKDEEAMRAISASIEYDPPTRRSEVCAVGCPDEGLSGTFGVSVELANTETGEGAEIGPTLLRARFLFEVEAPALTSASLDERCPCKLLKESRSRSLENLSDFDSDPESAEPAGGTTKSCWRTADGGSVVTLDATGSSAMNSTGDSC